MATFKAIVFPSANHLKSDGTSNIKIRIYHNKQSQYIPTQHYIKPHFLGKNGEVSEEYSGADDLNYEIGELIQQYRKQTINIGNSISKAMNCMDLKNYLVSINNTRFDFIDFVSFSREVISKTKKPKTSAWYEVALNSYIKYAGKQSIDIRDITSSKLTGYSEILINNKLEPGTVNNYLRALRSLFNKCKKHFNDDDLGIIRVYHEPFLKVKIPVYRKKRKNISVESIKLIRDSKCKSKREAMSRDVFMMLFYMMGINCSDFYNLKPPISGRIEYERSKTNTDENQNSFKLSIKIEKELQQLIDKYSTNGFLSDIKAYSDSYSLISAVNKGLKKLCENLKITKVSTNWARHSWASIARNKACISKADIDFCLGHVNNDYKMADIYIDIDYSIYDQANRKVLNLLK